MLCGTPHGGGTGYSVDGGKWLPVVRLMYATDVVMLALGVMSRDALRGIAKQGSIAHTHTDGERHNSKSKIAQSNTKSRE